MELIFHKISGGNADDTFYKVEGFEDKTIKEAVDIILRQNSWGRIRIKCVDFGNGRGDNPDYRVLSDYRDHQLEEADCVRNDLMLHNKEAFMSRKVIEVIADSTWGHRIDYTIRIASVYQECSKHYY